MPDGWSRGTADREVLVLKKGDVTVGFSHSVTPATAEALGPGASETTVAGLTAFTIVRQGERHLWYTDGQIEFASSPGDTTQTWVFGVGSQAVTVDIAVQAAGFDAAVEEFEPILQTFATDG